MSDSIIQFADLAVSNLTAGGGKLQDDQSDTFYRKVFDRTGLIGDVRAVSMHSDTMNINKIGLGSRILRVAPTGNAPYIVDGNGETFASNRTLPSDQRFNPSFEQVKLEAKEYIAEIHLTDDVIENNLEKDNLENIILDMAAQRLALDLEEALILGDTTNASLDPELRLQDGVLKRVTSNVHDHANAEVNQELFAKLQTKLPTKYLRNMANMRYYLHNHQELAWRTELSQRGTALGDKMVTGKSAVPALGVDLAPVATMPKSTVLFADPKNILVGLQRDMRLEYERYPRQRMTAFIFTLKVGFQIEEEEAIAKAINVASA